jgi:hypothetical protein
MCFKIRFKDLHPLQSKMDPEKFYITAMTEPWIFKYSKLFRASPPYSSDQ